MLLVALLIAAPTAGAAVAEPDPSPPTTARPVDRRILDAGSLVSAAEAARVALVGALLADDAALASLDRRIAAIDADLGPARAARDEVTDRLQGRAGSVYRTRDTGVGAALSLSGPDRLAAGAHYADALAVVDVRTRVLRQARVDDLEAQRVVLVDDRRAAADLRAGRAAALVEARGRADAAAERAAAAGATPVMGTSAVEAATLAAWFRASGHTAVLAAGTTVDDLTELYAAEADAEGVRADLAFAQAVLETGWFAHATDSNFAGIGACDSCEGRQTAFDDPRSGVRAQIQLLRNYADAGVRASDLRHAPERALFGSDPGVAARTFDRFWAKGSAPVWDAMGGGRWATDPDYATKVLGLVAQIRSFRPEPG